MDILPFLVTGVITGVIYGLAASGLVLTFKTSGLFNVGYGALLTAATLIFYFIQTTLGWDWKWAFIISVFIGGPVMGLMMEFVARHLLSRSVTYKIAGTVGLMVLVPALVLLFYPESQNGLRVARFLPFSDHARYRVRVFDVNVFGDQILTAAIVVVAVISLFVLLQRTRVGTAMRAVVDDPALLGLRGTSPARVRRLAWIIGCTFAALSGVLPLPSIGLHPYTVTFLATYAFAAAALGRFSSIPLAFLGGLIVGVAQDVIGFLVNKNQWASLTGLAEGLPFVILFAVLVIVPKRRFPGTPTAEAPPRMEWIAPFRVRLGGYAVTVLLLAAVPLIFSGQLTYFSFALCQAMLVLALGLLVRTSGQVSLCHATFAGIGAAVFSQFAAGAGMPWLLALLLTALVAIPVGAVASLPAIRLDGVYLALATFGFGILVQRLVFTQTWMFNTFSGSRKVPSPFDTTSPTARYYVVLVVLVVFAVAVTFISGSRLGRILRGMAGSQTAVSTLGLSTTVTKIIVFCASAIIAAIAGVMYGMILTNVDGGTPVFQPYNSFLLLAILTIAPFREPLYAVVAGVSAVVPAFFSGHNAVLVLNALFGVLAIVISMQGGQPPVPEKIRAVLTRFGRPRVAVLAHPEERPAPALLLASDGLAPVVPSGVAPEDGLVVDSLFIRFSGLVAVNNVSFSAPFGRITGLIGPNGAGKTSTFNALDGLNRDVRGRVRFKGADISSWSPAARGRLGLGRTFQRMELCDSLSVFDNVALGFECPHVGARPLRQFATTSSQRSAMFERSWEALELCGIDALAERQSSELSTGQRRLVELARCLAGPFTMLLLDEPSSGLDRAETVRFGEILEHVAASRGCGILLVEHDMSLVMRVCTHIYVLDFGQMIFDGTPSEVGRSSVVRAAYLGEEVAGLEVTDQYAEVVG
jgi:ABC-type branched-subunit amino acid transport system ATPase component/branched-subunit amino acid ABC-type transport system permease component